MADETYAVAGRLVMRLREAEKLAAEGKVTEARNVLKDVVKEARERGLEKPLRHLILRVKAEIRRRTRQ